eukprot:CAMPEP_0177680844 /NCGR_PEP_ID=MMETSP0447-20121125/30390_1 /TAXON_ID=0 /ORGANISM="Stygamoeba regulata, Strain BSH-02190019" /LENGTH=320 /DNA_ID=CAMNT_0019190203 /DNA_START=224 /DNA_END=1182 /DNA_ORIENTATION=-
MIVPVEEWIYEHVSLATAQIKQLIEQGEFLCNIAPTGNSPATEVLVEGTKSVCSSYHAFQAAVTELSDKVKLSEVQATFETAQQPMSMKEIKRARRSNMHFPVSPTFPLKSTGADEAVTGSSGRHHTVAAGPAPAAWSGDADAATFPASPHGAHTHKQGSPQPHNDTTLPLFIRRGGGGSEIRQRAGNAAGGAVEPDTRLKRALSSADPLSAHHRSLPLLASRSSRAPSHVAHTLPADLLERRSSPRDPQAAAPALPAQPPAQPSAQQPPATFVCAEHPAQPSPDLPTPGSAAATPPSHHAPASHPHRYFTLPRGMKLLF